MKETPTKKAVKAPKAAKAPKSQKKPAASKAKARPAAALEVMSPEILAKIARRAYELWEASGRLPERDVENWLAAERELLAPPATES
jgi:hypothetical protein